MRGPLRSLAGLLVALLIGWALTGTPAGAVVMGVLSLVARRTLAKGDLLEGGDGALRLSEPLTHELAATLPAWAKVVAPWAERMRTVLGQVIAGRWVDSAPLTGARRREAAAAVKARRDAAVARAGAPRRPRAERDEPASWSCPSCGGPVAQRRHVRCPACQAGDPRQAPEVRGRRGAAIAAARSRDAAWRDAGGQGPMPPWEPGSIAAVKLSAIMAAAGVSKSTAWSWRTGRTQPHERHRAALAHLAGAGDRAVPDASRRHHPPHHARLAEREVVAYEPLRRTLVAARLSTTTVAALTGLSMARSSRIARGALVPGRRHWAALAALVEQSEAPAGQLGAP